MLTKCKICLFTYSKPFRVSCPVCGCAIINKKAISVNPDTLSVHLITRAKGSKSVTVTQ